LILIGNYSYKAVSSPLLFDVIFDIAKSLKFSSEETVFERWFKNDPNSDQVSPRYDLTQLFYSSIYCIL